MPTQTKNLEKSQKQPINISSGGHLSIHELSAIIFHGASIEVNPRSYIKLEETRKFIDYIVKNGVKVYGLSTGFGDLREYSISPFETRQLSENIIQSHDAGIGESISPDIVLGAMVIRVNSLARGHSGFTKESLNTLVEMINHRIVPQIPSTGSLGASGDLAFLARLGRAMQGEKVSVHYQGEVMTAEKALQIADISPFCPQSKEGLALTNGTSFMASMLSVAYLRSLHLYENILALQGFFLNTIQAISAAFLPSIHKARGHRGQILVANILSEFFKSTPFEESQGVQNDYSIRCLPQILGPKVDLLLSFYPVIENEVNAVTDNPLIFKDEEIDDETPEKWIMNFDGSNWAVLSGGNFHGENLATVADAMLTANVKIALTLERQLTYILNPSRNGKAFPVYLIKNKKKTGLYSGFMITQYTANALAHKIALLANASSVYNLTSANEAEDIVSYGATACEKLLQQLDLLQQLTVIYLTVIMQAYSIKREKHKEPSRDALSEQIFHSVEMSVGSKLFPKVIDEPFDKTYSEVEKYLCKYSLRKILDYPLIKILEGKMKMTGESLPNPLGFKTVMNVKYD